MLIARISSPPGSSIPGERLRETLYESLADTFRNQKLLVLIPDHTRSLPLLMLFRNLVEALGNTTKLDFMVALGTHPPLSEASLEKLVGITTSERSNQFGHVGLLNHEWDNDRKLVSLGTITQPEVEKAAGNKWHPSLAGDLNVRINKAALEYDHILILGPIFPHEVAGFSGGAKYLFPGISGPEMINKTHWLGALTGVLETIGFAETPVRKLIHKAAAKLKTPVTLLAAVVEENQMSGLFIGDYISAWEEAVTLSASRHILKVEKPFLRVLSCAPTMYDELWTAAKAMYKLEPAVENGGEIIIYAPHLSKVSQVHGKYIYQIGYHILPYFLHHWDGYRSIPLGVLAHSTHLRGSGVMDGEIERPNIKVTLSSQIPPEDCVRLNLGYLDPASIRFSDWQNKENEGILFVPQAGEILYRA